MGKLNQLLGIANNLAVSFVSVTNLDFLKHLESLPAQKNKLFEIDLLKETVKPKGLKSNLIKKTIKNYKNWFLSEIKKLKIEPSGIKKVSVKISYKPGKTFAKYYTCNVTVKTQSRDYIKKAMSSYS